MDWAAGVGPAAVPAEQAAVGTAPGAVGQAAAGPGSAVCRRNCRIPPPPRPACRIWDRT